MKKETTKVNLRSAKLDDLPVLYDFEQGIITAERPYDSTLKPGHINYYDLKTMIKSEDTEVIVAEIENQVIGSAYINIRPAKPYLKHAYFGYLGFMFVKPEFRGMGVNKKIIDQIKTWAKTKNIKELRLDVYNDNFIAIKAYEKAGFEKHLLNMRIEIE